MRSRFEHWPRFYAPRFTRRKLAVIVGLKLAQSGVVYLYFWLF